MIYSSIGYDLLTPMRMRQQKNMNDKLSVTIIYTKTILSFSAFGQKWKTGTERIFYGYYRSIFNHCDIIGLQSYRIRCKRRKIRAITPFKVIQGHRGRY